MIFIEQIDKLIILTEEAIADVFEAVAFPVARGGYRAALLANELVSVQPLSPPTGLIFYTTPTMPWFAVEGYRPVLDTINGIKFYPFPKLIL